MSWRDKAREAAERLVVGSSELERQKLEQAAEELLRKEAEK